MIRTCLFWWWVCFMEQALGELWGCHSHCCVTLFAVNVWSMFLPSHQLQIPLVSRCFCCVSVPIWGMLNTCSRQAIEDRPCCLNSESNFNCSVTIYSLCMKSSLCSLRVKLMLATHQNCRSVLLIFLSPLDVEVQRMKKAVESLMAANEEKVRLKMALQRWLN